MNERIQKLIEQATSTQGPTPYNPLTFEFFDKEKFAHMIVQECIDMISPYTVSMNRPGEEYLHPILEIRKHFGVEE
jgi:hypothetical protein